MLDILIVALTILLVLLVWGTWHVLNHYLIPFAFMAAMVIVVVLWPVKDEGDEKQP